MWTDLGALVRGQIPDKNGHPLPADIISGAYEIQDLADQNEGYLYEAELITDKTYGGSAYGCAPCCGYGGTHVVPNPYTAPVGAGEQFYVWAINSCTDLDTRVGTGTSWISNTLPSRR